MLEKPSLASSVGAKEDKKYINTIAE